MRLVGAASAVIVAVSLVTSAADAQDTTAGRAKAAVCAACHGPDGNAPVSRYPALAGQTARYISIQLRDFPEGRRTDSLMSPIAKTLSRQDNYDVAAFFAARQRRPPDFKAEAAKVSSGEKKVAETLCTMCHGGGMMGQNEIPRVAGQNYDYVVKQLQDFKAARRTNDAGNMSSVSKTLSDEDIINVAQYLANLD